jgi:hypothetical protein
VVILIDSLLIGGVRFVLDKLATAVEREMNDDTHLRERLLDAQMRLELGELSEEEFGEIEAEVLARLREIREERQGVAPGPGAGEYKVAGVEASFTGDQHDTDPGKQNRRG